MYLNGADALYMCYAATCSTLGVAFNGFLLYLILFRSPPFLSPYTVFLANTCITQLCYSLSFVLTIPRVIAINFRIVNIYLGVTQFLGPWWCYMLFVVLLHFAVNSFISIMMSMIFRCLALKTLRFPLSAALFICLLGYLIPFSMVAFVGDIDYTSDVITNENYTGGLVDDVENYLTVVGTDVTQKSTVWVAFCMTGLQVPIYAVMFYCRSRILKMLERPSYLCSNSTTNHIRRLALTVQSLVPLFTIFPSSIIYVLTQVGIIETHLYSYFVISFMSLNTVVDPLVTIYYVQPYRKFVLDFLSDDDRSSPHLSAFERSRSRSSVFLRKPSLI
ncbi:unnamed protein product [Caenorhabditis auriculariae]|uniref:G-protein coupled receptors family 1 profile domain-containing protein n=1 Tax=Caenorhabditis auriculariae TaxID=2777116 RepID=A0A8S1HP02_9PELO|nr:unnamed protein product [Caenorhabditis auriculariae]